MNLFENRKLLIATKHGKEEVLKPLLESSLKVKCFLNTDFDTDVFGTFSGEVIRKDNALKTLRNKCLAAMSHYNCDLAVASEGSFGPHPAAFFSTADEEFVILIDLKNEIEIIGRKLSLETNFAVRELTSTNLLLSFLKQIKFPSHKIILKNQADKPSEVHKEMASEEEAVAIFELLLEKYGNVYAETDMRAMNNSTRMRVIEEAGLNLIEKINSLCPNCQFPGYSVTSSGAGLPCSCCNLPTKSILYTIFSCNKCSFSETKYYPRNVQSEDPMYCDNCNP